MLETKSKTTSEPTLSLFCRLRLLVGYLGEKDQESWWPTAFFAPTSNLFLEPVMPRTVRPAQYGGVCEAARRLHEERVAVGEVYHLFRLPEEVERDLRQTLLSGNDSWFELLMEKRVVECL